MTFAVKLADGVKEVPVEPFLIDLWRMMLHCPWCQLRFSFSASTSIHMLLSLVSHHIKEMHPEKHTGVAIGFLLAEPST